MDYIINPMWFYWVRAIANIGVFMCIVGIIGAILSLVMFFICLCGDDGYLSEDEKNKYERRKRTAVKATGAFVIIMFMSTLVPSEETMYKMMVAKYVTHENLSLSVDAIKEAVDYIVEKIGALK